MLISRPHFAADVLGNTTLFSAHSRQSTADDDLTTVIPAFSALTKKHDRVQSLVFTDGGAPTISQRRKMFDAIGDRQSVVRNAVITDATSARFVISAMSLVVEGIRAFSPDQFAEALAYLEYSDSERAVMLSKLRTLCKSLPMGRFLALDRVASTLDSLR